MCLRAHYVFYCIFYIHIITYVHTHTPQTKFQEHQTKLYIIRQFRKTLLSLGPALTVTHSSCELVYQKKQVPTEKHIANKFMFF